MRTASPLQQLIVERVQRAGQITFAEYMRMALYEPGYGYYVTGPARMGWQGDYYTSTDIGDFFAHCMARQLYQMWEQLDHPSPFVVIEQGAGRGDLGREILSWTAQALPDLHTALDYQATDIRTTQDALHVAPHPARLPSVILSNELVDAFPVHIVEKRDGRLYEVYIASQDGRLYELLDEASSPEVAGYLDSYEIPWQGFDDGWRAEINLDAPRWMEQTAGLLTNPSQHSFLLTIDYGEEAPMLYTNNRPYGTLTCYFQHQLTERPLARPGEQDITAHVNFSALIHVGQQYGLHLHTFTTQHQWLSNMGIHEEMAQLRASDFAVIDSARASNEGQAALFQWYNLRQRVSALTDPAGMGNFKALILSNTVL